MGIPAFQFYKVSLKTKRPQPPDYPDELKTPDDHLRRKRLDLKLLQRDVAERLGVDETTIYSWEKNPSNPSLHFTPKVIKFLGHFPLKCQESPIEKLKFYKRVNGLSCKRLGEFMGRDPNSWQTG
jgi:DNA-binding XRE family transcriptional regulator